MSQMNKPIHSYIKGHKNPDSYCQKDNKIFGNLYLGSERSYVDSDHISSSLTTFINSVGQHKIAMQKFKICKLLFINSVHMLMT